MEGIYHDADLKDSPKPEDVSDDGALSTASPNDFSNLPINQVLEKEEKVRLYSQMLRIRRFE